MKGIRANKRSPSAFISASILECKNELRDPNEFVKANAIKKLTFLRMMGYEFSWANFAIIEVMSSQRFGHKRVGYLAAAQSFNEETDVILLTTNLLKKEFKSSNVYEVGLAINCLSNIVTPDLARELLPDLTLLTQHSHGYIRKKAVLCLFKLFMKYPQGLRLTFDRVKQCLDDSEPAVVSCAVNVITELADKNPKNYLLMAPHFFNLLTSSSNNWMLIKVVKLLGSLVCEEPRLARKLLEPLAAIVQNTQAKSLLYEAVHTLTLALPYARKADGSVPKTVPAIVQLCSEKLKAFVEEADQNLKYLGLVGFVSLMKSNPKEVVEHRSLILRCLCDDDVTIRSRALELLTGMMTKKNLQELVDQLMQHVRLSEGAYRDELISKIVFMCSRDKYSYIVDFKWYLDTLIAMSRLHGTEHGLVISDQIIDVAIRVFPTREYCVGRMVEVVLGSNLVMGKSKDTIWEVLHAAAWVVGEYSSFVETVHLSSRVVESLAQGVHCELLRVLLSTRSLGLPARTQAVYIQAALKVFAAASNSPSVDSEQIHECISVFEANLPAWMRSKEAEVQERASTCHTFLSALELIAPKSTAYTNGDVAGANDEYDESSDSKAPDVAPPSSDFLGLIMTPSTPTPMTSVSTAAFLSPQAGVYEKSAPTLASVCIPEPMKPVNAKAQKRLPAPTSVDYNAPLDTDLLEELLKEDTTINSKRKLAIEEVYFGFFGASANMQTRSEDTLAPGSGDGGDDFLSQRPSEGENSSLRGPTPFALGGTDRADGTPFYLSGEGNDSGAGDDGDGMDVDFGEIKLGASDSDGDGDVNNGEISYVLQDKAKRGKGKSKKAKGKKAKGKKMKERSTDDSFAMKADAMAIFGGDMVYRSDDDDDDDDKEGDVVSEDDGTHLHPTAGPGDKVFEGLAKVDLTTPLAPDEVMPERRHREVPEPTGPGEGIDAKSTKHKSRKGKKKKKRKKGEVTDDLLDFGGDAAPGKGDGVGTEPFDTLGSELLLPLDQAADLAASSPQAVHLASAQASSEVGVKDLEPDEVDLNTIMSELAAGEWAEYSTKVKIADSSRGNQHVISQISAALGASVVPGSVAGDGSHATLAARSRSTRGKVRLMIKIKGGATAKVTTKATDKKLAKAVNKTIKGVIVV